MTLEEALRLKNAWRLLYSVDHPVANQLAEELAGLETEVDGEWVFILHLPNPEHQAPCTSS